MQGTQTGIKPEKMNKGDKSLAHIKQNNKAN